MGLVLYANSMARGRYVTTAPPGRRFAEGFEPQLTPVQILHLGAFGGRYLNSCRDEYPRSWFRRVDLRERPEADANHYGVISGMPLSAWRKRGWIHDDDPRGWFEWWCRYYCGRRHADDARQIARWRSYGPRHLAQLRATMKRGGDHRRCAQGLLQWAYDPRPILAEATR